MTDEVNPNGETTHPIETENEFIPTGPSVGDVISGRTVVGVRTVNGEVFISFGGNTWISA